MEQSGGMCSHWFDCSDGRRGLIRPAKPGDAEALIAAIDEVSREERYFLRSRFVHHVEVERELIARSTAQGNLFLVATLRGRLVGWVTLFRRPQEFRRHAAEVGIGVLQAFRGIGIGAALMRSAIDWASGPTGLERLELNVRASNPRAQRLYERLGFVVEGRRAKAVKDHRNRYDDLILMGYRLPVRDQAEARTGSASGRGTRTQGGDTGLSG